MKIYRGENIESATDQRKGLLKTCIQLLQYPSDLIHSGNPHLLNYFPVQQFIIAHVAQNKSAPPHLIKYPADKVKHFMSFSEIEERALYYACCSKKNGKLKKVSINADEVIQSTDCSNKWFGSELKYLIAELDISNITHLPQNPEPGLYSLCYNQHRYAFLVNVIEYLNSKNWVLNNEIKKAVKFSKRDKEWLVLPSEMLQDGSLSAMLHSSDILKIEVYEKIDGY